MVRSSDVRGALRGPLVLFFFFACFFAGVFTPSILLLLLGYPIATKPSILPPISLQPILYFLLPFSFSQFRAALACRCLRMQGPPSLIRYDPPVPAEDAEAKALKAKLKSAKLNDSKSIGSVGSGDDMLHTILPPR